MLGLLLVLFVIAPIADLVVLVRLGSVVGFLPTLALVLGTAVLGKALVCAQGTRAVAELRRELSAGHVPGRQMLDGFAILLGGALLIAPGLLSDLAGLTLLFPPTRRLLQIATRRWLERKLLAGTLTMSVLRREPGESPAREDPPPGLDPRKEIVVPSPNGGGGPGL